VTSEAPIRAPGGREVVPERPPLAYPAAARALAGCVAETVRLLWLRRMHLPSQRVGMRLRFADGTSARVYRETAVDRGATADPAAARHQGRGRGPVTARSVRSCDAPGRAASADRRGEPDAQIAELAWSSRVRLQRRVADTFRRGRLYGKEGRDGR